MTQGCNPWAKEFKRSTDDDGAQLQDGPLSRSRRGSGPRDANAEPSCLRLHSRGASAPSESAVTFLASLLAYDDIFYLSLANPLECAVTSKSLSLVGKTCFFYKARRTQLDRIEDKIHMQTSKFRAALPKSWDSLMHDR